MSQAERKIRVLVSGFEAFGGESENPTALLVESLRKGELKIPLQIEVEARVLPVEFDRGYQELAPQIEKFAPDVVLAFGQAGGRSRIEFERIAINLQDAEIPDNAGAQPKLRTIDPSGDLAYLSTLPLDAFVEALKASGIPVGISNSAGLYVCNDLFYRLQRALRDKPETLSGFIHVPYLPEQAARKIAGQEGMPAPASLPFETLKSALEIVLLEISKIPFTHR